SENATWHQEAVPAKLAPDLTAVSCTDLQCVAADSAKKTLSTEDATGTAWDVHQLKRRLLGLACVLPSLCVGGGGPGIYASTEPMSGNEWGSGFSYAYSTFLEPGVDYFGPYTSVACPTETLCVASMDSYNDFSALVTSTDPTGGESAWSMVEYSEPGPPVQSI